MSPPTSQERPLWGSDRCAWNPTFGAEILAEIQALVGASAADQLDLEAVETALRRARRRIALADAQFPGAVQIVDRFRAKQHLSDARIDELDDGKIDETSFTNADQLFFDQATEQAKTDDEVQQKAGANAFDNFALTVKDKILDMMIERMDDNAAIVAKFMNDPEFQKLAFRELAKKIYEGARGENPPTQST